MAGEKPLFFRDNLVTSESHVKRLTFESFGVRVSIESDRRDLLAKALRVSEKALLGKLAFIENPAFDLGYRFGLFKKDGVFSLTQNGERTNHTSSEYVFFKYFNSILRITVAENAVDKVFVHAGVIGLKGKAVLFPGRSFKGKSTLVSALIELGADYYSDEYAIIGNDGLVEAFPRDLCLRNVEHQYGEANFSPAQFGGSIGDRRLSVGSVIITEFEKRAAWEPELMTIGQAILETIPHTIPIKADPEMSLKILNLAFANAIFAKGVRGDIKKDGVAILAFLDKHLN